MWVEKKGKSGLDTGACPYQLIAPTKLHCHPYHSRAHTVTEKLTWFYVLPTLYSSTTLLEWKREEGGGQEAIVLPLSFWVLREPHWGNLHNERQVIIHMICSCQDTPTLLAPCCVPQWNCSHSNCSLHPISEVKQARKNQILPYTVKHTQAVKLKPLQ